MEKLISTVDESVNFVEAQLEGFLESRYVRRRPDYFVTYLSSHNGCNRGCQFCHLTATGQTMFESSTPSDFMNQANNVFQHWRKIDKEEMNAKKPMAQYVHFNFMARGEPLENEYLIEDADKVLLPLAKLAAQDNLTAKFNVSTIMPRTLDRELHRMFRTINPTIYYSIYSVNEEFRKKWLPAAMPVDQALDKLCKYQDMTKKVIKIHFAFIKGANDGSGDVGRLVERLNKSGLHLDLNVVRYNPFSPEQGQESDEMTLFENVEYMKANLKGKVKVIQRVGMDVFASCGTFVGSDFG